MKREEKRLLDLFSDYKAGFISQDDISLSDWVGILSIHKKLLREKEEEFAKEAGVSVEYVRTHYSCDQEEQKAEDSIDDDDDWLFDMEDYSEYLDDEEDG